MLLRQPHAQVFCAFNHIHNMFYIVNRLIFIHICYVRVFWVHYCVQTTVLLNLFCWGRDPHTRVSLHLWNITKPSRYTVLWTWWCTQNNILGRPHMSVYIHELPHIWGAHIRKYIFMCYLSPVFNIGLSLHQHGDHLMTTLETSQRQRGIPIGLNLQLGRQSAHNHIYTIKRTAVYKSK